MKNYWPHILISFCLVTFLTSLAWSQETCICPPYPPPSSGGDQQICVGEPMPALTATAGTGLTVDWYQAPAGGDPVLAGSITFTPSVAGTFYAEARHIVSGCVSDTRTPVTLAIHSPPIADAGADQTVCAGAIVQLTAFQAAGYSYQWSTGARTPATTAIPMSETSYVLTVMRDGCVAKDTVWVHLSSDIQATIQPGAPIACHGDSTGSLSVSLAGGAPPYELQWFDGSGQATVAGLPAGIYKLTVTDASGCASVFNPEITEPPQLQLLDAGITEVISDNGDWSCAIEVTTNGGTPPYHYAWRFQGSVIAETEDIAALTEMGEYQLQVRDDNGCALTEIFRLETTTSVSNESPMQQIALFPNPTAGWIHLDLNSARGDAEVTLLDAWGRLLQRQPDIRMLPGELSLDLGTYPAGLYWLRLRVGKQVLMRKVIRK